MKVVDNKGSVFDSSTLANACDWLTSGNLLAYPTESVWGMGCDPFNEQAVQQILKIKNRPIEKGLIVIAPQVASIRAFLSPLPTDRQQAILKSWDNQPPQQQATTWLFPVPAELPINIPAWVTGGHTSLAIRVIQQPTIAKLCQTLISPSNPYGFLISTSCNPSGKPPAKNLSQAQAYFDESIGYFDDSTLNYTQPSQIKHAITGEQIRQ